MAEEENRIVRIIKKINTDRNKACYQNILSFAKRENKEIEMDLVKEVTNNLLERNIIYDLNKGKVDKESFKLVVVDESSADKNNQINITGGVDDGSITPLENLINDNFYEL